MSTKQEPWRMIVDPYADGLPYYVLKIGAGHYDRGTGLGGHMAGIISAADARLIAEAPALLAALKVLVAAGWRPQDALGVQLADDPEPWDQARAAIALAEGDEPRSTCFHEHTHTDGPPNKSVTICEDCGHIVAIVITNPGPGVMHVMPPELPE